MLSGPLDNTSTSIKEARGCDSNTIFCDISFLFLVDSLECPEEIWIRFRITLYALLLLNEDIRSRQDGSAVPYLQRSNAHGRINPENSLKSWKYRVCSRWRQVWRFASFVKTILDFLYLHSLFHTCGKVVDNVAKRLICPEVSPIVSSKLLGGKKYTLLVANG